MGTSDNVDNFYDLEDLRIATNSGWWWGYFAGWMSALFILGSIFAVGLYLDL